MKTKIKVLGTLCAVAVGVSGFVFSQRSINNLVETHADMQRVTTCALKKTTVDFVVIDGLRTAEEHRINVANGRSWTRRSLHQDGLAVDVAAYVNGVITYKPEQYYPIAAAFYYCSEQLDIPITWGGEWRVKDLMHFELHRGAYP